MTGCPLDANNIIFRAYRRLICCYPCYFSRETWVGMSMAILSLVNVFYSMYQACMSSGSFNFLLLPEFWPPHPSVVVYCNTWYNKKTKPSADTRAIDPWVRVVPSIVWTYSFQGESVRVGHDVFVWATWNVLVIFTRYCMSLLGAFSVDLAYLRNHLLPAFRYWYCGCYPLDTGVGRDISRYPFSSTQAGLNGFSSNLRSK